MILFCRIKILQRFNLYLQRTGIVGCQTVNGFTDNRQVRDICIIDACTILSSTVIALTVQTGRGNCFEVKVDKKRQVCLIGVILYLYCFGKVCSTGAHLLIGRVGYISVCISHPGSFYPFYLLQKMFGSPKTSPCQINLFHWLHITSPFRLICRFTGTGQATY